MTAAVEPGPRPLVGRRVLVTRERPGRLAELLTAVGADVTHVPLIEAAEAPDGGAALQAAVAGLSHVDWLVVTSPNGAERVGQAACDHPHLRLAAVGTASAATLRERAGRDVDVVPERQIATSLAEALIGELGAPSDSGSNARPARILIAQADRASDTLAVLLRAAGHDVTTVTAYSTVLTAPDVDAIAGADALVFASGSAVTSWVHALGALCALTPPIIVAIGPSTAGVAADLGLKVTSVAADHSLEGLVDELVRQLERAR